MTSARKCISHITTLPQFFRSFPVIERLRTRWGDLDASGIVNSSVSFRYLQESRIRFLGSVAALAAEQDSSFDAAGFQSVRTMGPIAATVGATFVHPLGHNDTILVGTRGEIDASLKRLHLDIQIWSLKHSKVCTIGWDTITSYNYVNARVEPYHPAFVKAFHALHTKDSTHLENVYSIPLDS